MLLQLKSSQSVLLKLHLTQVRANLLNLRQKFPSKAFKSLLILLALIVKFNIKLILLLFLGLLRNTLLSG